MMFLLFQFNDDDSPTEGKREESRLADRENIPDDEQQRKLVTVKQEPIDAEDEVRVKNDNLKNSAERSPKQKEIGSRKGKRKCVVSASGSSQTAEEVQITPVAAVETVLENVPKDTDGREKCNVDLSNPSRALDCGSESEAHLSRNPDNPNLSEDVNQEYQTFLNLV